MRLQYHGQRIRVEGADGQREICLTRAQSRNALDAVMRDELHEALSAIAVDPAIRGIALVADGPDFCAGGDLFEFGSATDPAVSSQIRLARSLPLLFVQLQQRLVVGIQGAAVGAGIELAAFARVVVAAEGARFKLPELDMGLIPGCGGTVSITRRIGPARALGMMLDGGWIDAHEALAIGLVDVLVGTSELRQRTREEAFR